MPKRDIPTGFVARCRCGALVGALDWERSGDANKVIRGWLKRGYIIEPRFGGTWSADLESCRCDAPQGAEREGA